MAIADVEVFGAGVFGLSIAYSCARRGCKVRVIEKRSIGSGASGGPLGALAPHAPDGWNAKKQFQFESLVMAEDWWAAAAEAGGVPPGYRRHGRIQPIPSRNALALAGKRQNATRKFWGGRAEWRIIKASGSWMPAAETGYAVYDTLSASIQPKSALACLVAAVRALGGEILEGSVKGGGAEMRVDATGHEGLRELRRALGSEAGRGEKGQAALLGFDARGRAQIFADGIHVIPHGDGTVAVGSTSERHHSGGCGTDSRLEDLIARAKCNVPAIRDAPVVARWAGIRPRAATRAPLLGPYPGRPGCYIANGGFKIGFGIAPLTGEAMADLMLSGRSRIPYEFSPLAVAEKGM